MSNAHTTALAQNAHFELDTTTAKTDRIFDGGFLALEATVIASVTFKDSITMTSIAMGAFNHLPGRISSIELTSGRGVLIT